MFQFKENSKTLKNFMDAIQAVSGNTGTSFKEPLSYIGTFYESPFLPSIVLAEPTLNVEEFGKDDIKLKVVLKPEPAQVEQVKVLDTYLNTINKGFMEELPEKITTVKDPRPSQAFLSQQSGISDIQNYPLNVNFNDAKVVRQDTTINGIKYYLFSLEDTYHFGEGLDYTHNIHCLMKDKTSDGENFFSSLIDKKLNVKDTKKVLDTLSGNNMTGLFIGGYSFGDEGVVQQVFSISSELAMTWNEGYIIKGYSTFIEIPDEVIQSLTVRRRGSYRYNLELETTDGRITLFIG